MKTIYTFAPISLTEMDSVALLNRTDTKFVFHRAKLNEILLQAKQSYRVLEIQQMRYADYDTNYFDTDNYKFYYDHHNRRPARYKVRMRSYVNSELHFFEIKYKSNQNRTVKSRIKIPKQENEITGNAAELLKKVIGISPDLLKKSIQIKCKRTTLVNRQLTERVTIDFDMQYYINGAWHSYPDVIIIELKQDKSRKSKFLKIMCSQHLHSVSLSKYSFGIANFIPGIKNNNFKTQILFVNKLCNNHAI
ncbi:MAG: polyphosphate polymerase domain-containing protein [Paludibacteraceae bacterium]